MRNRAKVDMLNGSITRGLLRLAVPIMVMNVFQNLFNIIDMTVLKSYSSEQAVGAVGACGTLIALCTSLLIGIAAGANVAVAKRIGAKDGEGTENAVHTAFCLALLGGVLLLLVGTTFAETFLRWTNCPESLLPKATIYFKIYFYGVPILMLYNFCASILRAAGDTKRPMYYLLLAGIIKATMTLVFVRVFHFSVEGVALATIISQGIAVALALGAIRRTKDIPRVKVKSIRLSIPEMKEILYIGLPAGMQSALYSLANVVITSAVNKFGADATTGIAIANQFDGILYQITYAPSLATIPYVAQNMGAGNLGRVKKTLWSAILITVAFGATFGALSAIFSSQLSSIMSSSPAVIAYSRQKMIIISSTYFICGINEVMGGVLKGMAKPILPTVATLVYMCLFRFVWVYMIFPLCPSLTFLYTVWPIGWILSILTLAVAYVLNIRHMEGKHFHFRIVHHHHH